MSNRSAVTTGTIVACTLGAGVLAWYLLTRDSSSRGANDLSDFLRRQRDLVRRISEGKELPTEKLHVVMGNEAADLDSMCSAIMYAYLQHHISSNGPFYIPLMNIPREELPLRGEAHTVFQRAEIDPASLVFLDDLDLEKLHAAGKLSVTLVDHNRLSSSQAFLEDSVEAIVDHHLDEHLYDEKKMSPRVIQPVGSCCSLILSLYISTSSDRFLDRYNCFLLLAPVLLDTGNMKPELKKGTPLDAQALQILNAKCGEDLAAVTEELQVLRADTSRLTTPQLLIKDAKYALVEDYICCVSSVPLSIAEWIERDPEFVKNLRAFCARKTLNVLVIMTGFTDQTTHHFRRELVLFAPDKVLHESFVLFMEASSLSLKLESVSFPQLADGKAVAFFEQGDVSKSRKQVMPIVVSVLSTLSPK